MLAQNSADVENTAFECACEAKCVGDCKRELVLLRAAVLLRRVSMPVFGGSCEGA